MYVLPFIQLNLSFATDYIGCAFDDDPMFFST